MYTNCTIVCPTTTPNMVSVQNELKNDGLTPQIISFSIDPSFDTPEVLKDYADDFGADLDHWSFLTGNEFKDIQKLSEDRKSTRLNSSHVAISYAVFCL